MLILFTENLIYFITIIIFSNILSIKNLDYVAALNISSEIKSIFGADRTKDFLEDLPKTGNYAEGGLVHQQNLVFLTSKKLKNSVNDSQSKNQSQNIQISEDLLTQNNDIKENKTNKLPQSINHSKLINVKLNNTGTNLFLGMPEVIHINGISSIKPRKGVYYNKIVPRKGVGNENEGNYSLNTEMNCPWLTENDCYNLTGSDDENCFCCKIEITQIQLLNCNKCYPSNTSFNEELKCQSICCKIEKLNITKISSVLNVNNYNNNINNYDNLNKLSRKISNKILPDINALVHKELNYEFELNSFKNKSNLNDTLKNIKLKPFITKVPYDIEIVTNLFGSSTKEIIVPVAALLFLLPLVGILIYFIWRRIKDYWEKRYYKRMDFLIDGMYND